LVCLHAGNSGREALTPIGSPIVLQRRGSVYGANVPMITGIVQIELIFKNG
jgi:potassium large conductance calcium-activated channel subfamily M alpha protein 1